MRRPDRGEPSSDHAYEHQERGNDDRWAALQTARRAEADELTHEEPEIEGTGMNQDALENVRVAAQMRAPHAARVVDMRERAFDQFAASPHQAPSTSSTNPAAIAIHRRLGLGLLRPIASPAVRLGDVGPEAHGLE